MIFQFKRIHSKRKTRTFVSDASVKGQLQRLFFTLLAILIVHTIAMVQLEQLNVSDAVWLTMTSATTVGYGDLSAQTLAGRMATIILLYVGGIAILAQVAALYFEYRQEIKDRKLKGD